MYSTHTERLGSDELVIVESDAPSLSIDTTLRQASRGRGQVVCVACASDVVYVATSRGYVLRYHWDEYGNEKVSEVEVVKAGSDAHLMAMWCDPHANHLMMAVKNQGTFEVHYLHRRWPKPRALAKLRGTCLTALAWPPLPPSHTSHTQDTSDPHSVDTAPGSALTDTCTGPMLLGTDAGLLHELSIEEPQALRREPGPPRQLLDLKDRRKRICGLAQELCVDGSLLVVVATPLALYLLRGPEGTPSLEALLSVYAHAPLLPALEAMVPGQSTLLPHSQLQLHRPSTDDPTSTLRFGWLVGGLVYHGEVVTSPITHTQNNDKNRNTQRTTAAPIPPRPPSSQSTLAPIQPQSSVPAPDMLLRNVCLLPLRDVGEPGGGAGGQGGAGGVTPTHQSSISPHVGGSTEDLTSDDIRDMVMTEWHFVVVDTDKLRAINRVSGLCAVERVFRSPLMSTGVSGEVNRTLDGLVVDPTSNTMYMYSDESLYEVQLLRETQGLWRVFMELQDWDAALRLCANAAQRDVVHQARADAAMAARDYNTAALHYAKIVGGQPPFEEIALRLIEAAAPKALLIFLNTRLSCLSKVDRAQSTMLAAWLLELQLDTLSKLLLESGGVPTSEYQTAESDLSKFLTTNVEALDVGTTVSLLAGAGRTQELLTYAQARQDHSAVLEALLQRPDGASKALSVLRKPSCPQELIYRFAPVLMVSAPDAFVDLLITTRPALEPRQLVPALLRFSEPGAPLSGRQAVLRYVAFVVDVLNSQDSAVHDLAAALYSLEEGEAGLLAYMARARSPTGLPLYDPKYVLRLATERGKRRAEVKLLCELGMYEDAVARALRVDLSLAQSAASAPPEEETGLRHRLWLSVAKHVVQADGAQADAISKAVQLLKEAGGLLKIEDVLPFFPDFVTIDNFKEAICDSLERYNRQIDQLKSEMEEATQIADAVRKDMRLLQSRTAVVRVTEPCARCGAALADSPPLAAIGDLPTGGLLPPLFVFPTGLVYHGVCCAAEVCQLAPVPTRQRITQVMTRLAKARGPLDETTQALLSQFNELVASEDPRNGNLLVGLIDAPYVAGEDAGELATWAA